MRACMPIAAAVTVWLIGGPAPVQGSPVELIETVVIGNPGNPGDAQLGVAFGGVDYVYRIGKCEVTGGQTRDRRMRRPNPADGGVAEAHVGTAMALDIVDPAVVAVPRGDALVDVPAAVDGAAPSLGEIREFDL